MQLLNPALIYGLAFAAIPVILHLLMRTKPKRVVFPALRLIRQRRLQNVRRIRLRHFWLLLLRMLVLAGFAAAVVRPSLPAANYGLTTRETLTLIIGASVLLAAYGFVMRYWRTRKLSPVALASRRTFLRGGVGGAGFLLFLLLFVWPYYSRVRGELTGPIQEVSADVPVAAVFLFDTSLSMDYREENQTRLEIAKSVVLEQIDALPPRSRVAIADCSSAEPILFQADMAGAKTRIESLQVKPRSLPLNDRVRSAVVMQDEDRQRTLAAQAGRSNASEQFAREIYLLTDLSRSAWQPTSAALLREELDEFTQAGIYVIDVGVEQPRNLALTGLKLSKESVAADAEVVVEASLTARGLLAESVAVELFTESESGTLIKQDVRSVKLTDEAGTRLQFAVKASGTKSLRGEMRIVGSDPLTADNRLWFTVGHAERVRVLVSAPAAGDQPQHLLQSDANELVETLRVLNHDVRFVPAHRLEQTDLANIDALFLLNVAAPGEALWKKLDEFVSRGGGLMVCLGSAEFWSTTGIRSVAWNTPEAQALLPGELVAALRFEPPQGLDVRNTAHPVLQKFDAQGMAAEVALIPVWRYWKVKPADDASVIARFTDKAALPALLERPRGKGRTLMLTTAANLSLDLSRQWSRLAGEWPFLILVDRSVLFLAQRGEAVFNLTAGEPLILPLNGQEMLRQYLLRKPGGAQRPGEVPPASHSLLITETDEVGPYLIKPREGDSLQISFSVNPPPGESDFARLTTSELDVFLGENRYRMARNMETLQRSVTTGRLGVEIFPHILALVILAFCLEHLSAIRFYESDETQPAPA